MDDSKQPGEEEIDAIEMWRCPQLGGPVNFKYCRVMNNGLPCPRIIGCWRSTFDIIAYLEAHYCLEDLQKVFDVPSKDRWTRIVDALDKAKGKDAGDE